MTPDVVNTERSDGPTIDGDKDPDDSGAGSNSEITSIRVVRGRARQRRVEKRRRRVTQAMVPLTAVFAAAVVVLAVAGWRTTLQITGGREVKVTDPAAPGYTAEASTTDVQLLVLTGDEGELAVSLLLVGGAGTDHLSIIPISGEMVVWDFEDALPQATRVVYAQAGMDVLLLRLGADLTLGLDAGASMPMAGLTPVFERIGPVTLDLPDIVYGIDDDGVREIHYPAGELTLEPSQFAEFLSYTDNNEGELNRSLRVNPLWERIITTYVQDPDLVATSVSAAAETLSLWDALGGAGGTDDALDSSEISIDVLPTEAIPMYVDPPASVSRVDQVALGSWVPATVPFPTPAFPGQRVIVSLLNGTSDAAVLKKVSPLVVAAGGSIGLTGNGMSFDVATTMVEYSNESNAESARRIAEQLGAVPAMTDLLPSGVDVQVTVGKDQA